MKNFTLLLLTSLLFVSCSKDNQDEEILQTLDLSSKNNKIDVCHNNGDQWQILSVSENALRAHEDHGDVLLQDNDKDGFVSAINSCLPGGDCDDNDPTVYPGAKEICGDGIDNNCDGQIDEDCCPYFTVEGVIAAAANYQVIYNFRTDTCIQEKSILFVGNPCLIGLSYDADRYGTTLVLDANCNIYTAVPEGILNACESVLDQAQEELQLASICGTARSAENSKALQVIEHLIQLKK